MQLQLVPLIIVIAYLIGMLAIGYLTNKFFIKGSEDYLVAGRRLGVLFVAASLAANNVGGGSSVGVAQRAFTDQWGLSAGWYVLAAAIGVIPLAYFAPYIRKAVAITIPEVVERRFGVTAGLITAILNATALFCLTASQILASGTIISALVGLDLSVAIIFAAFIVIVYTVMGGLFADALSDLIQWFVISFGLLVAVPFVISGAGGWEAITAALPPGHLSWTKVGFTQIFSLIIMYFVTFLSGPEIISRFNAAENEATARKAALFGAVLMGVYAFIPAFIGVVARAKFPEIESSQALVTAVFNLAPEWIGGLVAAAIISATMSSADSDMLCASSIIVKDIIQKYFKPDIEDRKIITLTRVFNVIIGLGGMFIALFKINIITLNTFSFALRSAGPFAAFGLGLVWKSATKNAGILSILGGAIGAIVWQVLKEPFGILAIVFGAAVSIVVFALVTVIENAMGVPPAPSAYLDELKKK
ncbi:MAG TPA: sodium:solute symporter family protein [Clostridia bacterium]|nr:sodium:solute symporter family protein [Clostridia bacterium]